MENLLILGARGMLGGQLRRLFPAAVAWDLEDVNVLDFDAFQRRVESLDPGPGVILNCVAFNDVDGSEERRDQAFALNAEFPGQLAALAASRGAALVHYSSNYVFDGAKGEYTESDVAAPLSTYGLSKLAGEQAVAAAGGIHYIVRTSVVFGPKGSSPLSKRSFVDLMLDLAEKRATIQAVGDEINSITYAPDLAGATRKLLADSPPPGVYHLTNTGEASWCDFAREVFRLAGRAVTVTPVPATAFPRKATRPARAVLLNTRRPPLRPWRDALCELLARPDRLS